MNFVGTGQLLSGEDFARAADKIGCEQAAIRTLTFVEARGQGVDAKRRPIVLPERHVFYRNLSRERGSARSTRGSPVPTGSRALSNGSTRADADPDRSRADGQPRLPDGRRPHARGACAAKARTEAQAALPALPGDCAAHIGPIQRRAGDMASHVIGRWEVLAANRNRQADNSAAWWGDYEMRIEGQGKK